KAVCRRMKPGPRGRRDPTGRRSHEPSDPSAGREPAMTREDRRRTTGSRSMTRRRWLGGAAAATGAAVAGGLPDMLAHAQAPAAPRGTRLHLLQWSHFVQAADALFERQAAEFGKQAGVQVQVERI